MNHFFKKHIWLAAAVISATVSTAYADDLFDDSFFADPAPVDAAKPAEPAKEEKTEQAPAETASASAAVADLNPAPAPAEPQLSMDIPASSSGLDVPPPPPSDFGFDSSKTNAINLSTPPSDQVLGKISSDVFREMAEMDYFDHKSSDGSKFSARLTAAGIDWQKCAENIDCGYTDPFGALNGWYNSESGHRNNILSDTYTNIGIGFAYGANSYYGYYGTQDFYKGWD